MRFGRKGACLVQWSGRTIFPDAFPNLDTEYSRLTELAKALKMSLTKSMATNAPHLGSHSIELERCETGVPCNFRSVCRNHVGWFHLRYPEFYFKKEQMRICLKVFKHQDIRARLPKSTCPSSYKITIIVSRHWKITQTS